MKRCTKCRGVSCHSIRGGKAGHCEVYGFFGMEIEQDIDNFFMDKWSDAGWIENNRIGEAHYIRS